MSSSTLLNHLSVELKKSMSVERKKWATEITGNHLPLTEFFPLFDSDEKTRNRFLMLISDIGNSNPVYLREFMPDLLERTKASDQAITRAYMAKWWYYAGIPMEQEGEALDLLFGVLLSPELPIHIKTPAFHAARKLVVKYPELQPEFIQVLEDQLGKISAAFDQRSLKYIKAYRSKLGSAVS